MKKVMLAMSLMGFAAVSQAQASFEILKDPLTGEKMLEGAIQKKDVALEPEFKWYEESRRIYPVPNEDAVKAMIAGKDSLYFIVFGGTWCEDTHFVLPKFFKIQEAAGFPESHIVLYAVDRNKKMKSALTDALNVYNVPTIIVMKNGKELGRVVEYGKTGYWDKELAEIMKK